MVDFVGAGCGAPDLLTLRGKRLIERADVIIYAGSLVNPELLSFAKAGCEMHDSAYLSLGEVIEIIEKAEKEGKNTVRLHSGDPCLYGAVREQFERLREMDIPFEVCPGVSSMCGAAAALKAEYTVPGVSQSVIVTRMSGRTLVPERENIAALAAHGTTMVIFLSTGMLERLSAELIMGGYAPEAPAAIVYRASWSDEKVLRCTVKTLAETAEREGVKKTALICVGGFLGEEGEPSRLYDESFSTEYRGAKS